MAEGVLCYWTDQRRRYHVVTEVYVNILLRSVHNQMSKRLFSDAKIESGHDIAPIRLERVASHRSSVRLDLWALLTDQRVAVSTIYRLVLSLVRVGDSENP